MRRTVMKKTPATAILLWGVALAAAFGAGRAETAKEGQPTPAAGIQAIKDPGKNTFPTLSEYEKYLGKKLTLKESPVLAALVKEGKLPPLGERLPEEPLVFLPASSQKLVGRYGGILRQSSAGPFYVASSQLQNMARGEHTYNEGFYPNVVRSLESADGGREWIFTLRKGLKWSDGHPFTMEDVRYFYDDIATYSEYTPYIWDGLKQKSGQPAKMVVLDDWSFKLVYETPIPISEYCDPILFMFCFYPKHYLQQFHARDQDKDKLDKMVKDGGYNSWVAMHRAKVSEWNQDTNPDKPVLAPWVCVQPAPSKVVIYKRNPYYHVVDADGNQLPYIDEVRVEETADLEVAKLRAIQGELDFMTVAALDLYPAAKEAEKKGNIKVTRWAGTYLHGGTLEFNLNAKDPILRDVFRDKRFRFGVSYAINREMISTLNYLGLVQPQQAGYSKNTPFYDERLLKTAIEFDPSKANNLLDEVGLGKRDSDGWRLRPDGKRLQLDILANVGGRDSDIEIVVSNLKAVGLSTSFRMLEFTPIYQKRNANEIEVVYDGLCWGSNEGKYAEAVAVGVPYNRGWWCPLWTEWFLSDGARGEKPVPVVLEAIDAYWTMLTSVDLETRKQAMKKITSVAADNLWTVGTVSHPGFTVIHSSKLLNVPTDFKAWNRGDFGRPALWFFAE